jgi:hypothetical protein
MTVYVRSKLEAIGWKKVGGEGGYSGMKFNLLYFMPSVIFN